jgi:UDP-N-acetylglucosamine 4,6-dehydratase
MPVFLSIGQVGEKLGLPATTIRYWERILDDLWQPRRSDGGQRRYTEEDLALLRRVQLLSGKMKLEFVKSTLRKEQRGKNESASVDWTDKVVLITGGTGSFGRHFCKVMLAEYHPKVIRIFSRGELKQHEMRQEFGDEERLRYFIGDVRDVDRLRRAMEGVDFVVHGAALKQVPACEYNPFEAVKTNIHGAQNVINAAIDARVKKVIALSTDKAVNPVNLYGATKLCSDKLFIQGNAYSAGKGTRFSCVRYGNVIGSRGSVIPLFIKQRESGRLTVTDRRMTRFWITLDEAVELVVKGFTHMQGGEIFVPRIPSMRIMDLAMAVAPECGIDFIGIRPGEKLHEALTGEDEARNTICYDGMYVILPNLSWWQRKNYRNARKLPEDFVYTSDKNDMWITVEELREVISGSGAEYEPSVYPIWSPVHK